MKRLLTILLTVHSVVIAISNVYAQEKVNYAQEREKAVVYGEPDDSILRHLPNARFTTEAYQREALRMLIEEASHVAQDLNLSEQLPITSSNLTEVFISPPALGMLGTISTSNYAYSASIYKRFSGLVQINLGKMLLQERTEYLWPMSRMDTNGAFQVATQIMAKAGMSLSALNRDCTVGIVAILPEGPRGKHFVPDYSVTWRKSGKLIAFVEFLEPTKSIRQLSVFDPKYILREPIRVPNLAKLLNQTNAAAITNAPGKE